MADKLVTWKERNSNTSGELYDTLYPATIGSQISDLYEVFQKTVDTSWTEQAMTFTGLTGVDSDTLVEVSLRSGASEAQAKEYAALGLYGSSQGSNQITLKYSGSINTNNIPIDIIVWKGSGTV